MTMTTPKSVNTSQRRRACTQDQRGHAADRPVFDNERRCALVGTPSWQDLPAATQAVLTSLMARLILDRVETRRAGPRAEAGHDL